MVPSLTPVFVFSLPRSGSTLAQRILAAHPAVKTIAEPWILLPLVYALKNEGIYAEYAQCTSARAINEFLSALPEGTKDYYTGIRELVLHLYTGIAGEGTHYFLDKTPRYHLIIEDVLSIFPEAKCLILWRNPLAVAASIINTWGKAGRWNLYRYKVDLYKGVENLVHAVQKYPDRFIQVRYEDAVTRPAEIWPAVFSHVGLEYDDRFLRDFSSVRFSGSMGDSIGSRRWDAVSAESVGSWPRTFDNPLRRAWARRYLEWIGEERLSTMGYQYAELRADLARHSRFRVSGILSDAIFMSIGAVHSPLDLSGVKRQMHRALERQRSYAAT